MTETIGKFFHELQIISEIPTQPNAFTTEIRGTMVLPYPIIRRWFGTEVKVIQPQDLDLANIDDIFTKCFQSVLRESGRIISSEIITNDDIRFRPEQDKLIVLLKRVAVIRSRY